MGVRTCACGCGQVLPVDAHHRRKYVDEKHQNRAKQRRRRRREFPTDRPPRKDRKPAHDASVEFKTAAESEDGRGSARRGPKYVQFVKAGWPERILSGEFKAGAVSEMLDEPGANVSRWMAAFAEDVARGKAIEDFEPDASVLGDFEQFTRKFFPEALIPEFHMEWAEAITSTVDSGGRLLLLAPQRHGKSEMLIRYCIWRIVRDPNIRIIWVGATQSMAERMVGFVRQHLEHNEALVGGTIGADTFVPPSRSGLPWTNSELTVATRNKVLKSPTMTAIGKGGTIIGRDADLIVLDDPQDRTKADMSPLSRDRDREWFFTDFMSRKEQHTGLAFITSRQHMDDLAATIMKEHSEDWKVLLYRAHDPSCTQPEYDFEAHEDCVLWPEKRTWTYLFSQKRANADHFQRNYQNDPRDGGVSYITAKDLDRIKDTGRRIGEAPSGCRLIAGIDPAESKPVAAVLWGYDGERRHIVDFMEAPPSVIGLRKVLDEWSSRYGVGHFVFEKNMAGSWLKDREVADLRRERNLKIEEHYTSQHNKRDEAIGPVAMFQRMRKDPPDITVPWGDAETQVKVERLLRVWAMFDPEWANSKHADDDLTMASWFPQPVMDRWDRPSANVVEVDFRSTGYQAAEWNTSPWSGAV